MKAGLEFKTTHVVDILANTIGRDQSIMILDKSIELVSNLNQSYFCDDSTVFFDPFCKAGEILLACAYNSCKFKALENIQKLNLDFIKNEIYNSSRYFALSPDERHYRLSLRTFLGNQYSHDKQYNKFIKDGHYLSEIDGQLDCMKFKKEFLSMIEYIKTNSNCKRIIVVGNPPYQESDGGFGKSAKTIYNFFVNALVESKDISEFLVVLPARWFSGGKGLDSFRTHMMGSGKIKSLRYFKNASEVFPTVDINGGICFLHYEKNYCGLTTFGDGEYEERLHLNEFDIISDDPFGYSIVRKIKKIWNEKYIGDVAWSRNPFGLSTDFFEKSQNTIKDNPLPCLSRNKIIKFVDKSYITKNTDKIDLWKVSVPKAAGGSKGKRRSTIPVNQIFLIDKGTVSTETYNIIEVFENKNQAENLIKYLQTNFARYLVGLRKITQDVTCDRWNWVPYLDPAVIWTDIELYKLFNLSTEEKNHIIKKVQEWS